LWLCWWRPRPYFSLSNYGSAQESPTPHTTLKAPFLHALFHYNHYGWRITFCALHQEAASGNTIAVFGWIDFRYYT
jgi:hypothetical protein